MIRAALVVVGLLIVGTAYLASTSGQQGQPKRGMSIDSTADRRPIFAVIEPLAPFRKRILGALKLGGIGLGMAPSR